MPDPNTKTYLVARRLTMAGVSVLPVRPGTKSPAVKEWKPLQTTIADEITLKLWFKNGNGLAIIGGRVSLNLELLDYDERQLYDAFRQACIDNGLEEIEQKLVLVGTPSGGSHAYYRCVSAPPGNQKLAMTADGQVRIETRGEGGYALTFPTEGYTLLRGRLDDLQVLTDEEVAALKSVAFLFDESPVKEDERYSAAPRADGELTPGDDFNTRGDYETVLQTAGWRRLHSAGGRSTWQRPGKSEPGVSATTGYQGARILFVFSTNAAPFEPKRKYSPFAVYSLLRCGGDFTEAARRLAEEGYGAPARKGRRRRQEEDEEEEDTENAESPDLTEDDMADAAADAQEKEGRGGASDATLARMWAKSIAHQYCWVEGDQYFEYADGVWLHSTHDDVWKNAHLWLLEKRRRTKKVVVSLNKIRSVWHMGRSGIGPYKIREFNAHPNWIPLRNGVLDIETGQLLVHAPENRLTYQLPYAFDADAQCPLWRAFLSETFVDALGDPLQEWIDVIQEWFGYCLIPNASAQVSMFWVGDGANGKGVAARVLAGLVGEESTIGLPIEHLDKEYHLAALAGKLVGFVNEPDPRAMTKNGEIFKAIVAGDQLAARRPTEKVFTFRSTIRVVISCNNLPSTKDVSNGYYRRVLLIEFRNNVAEEKRDPQLDEKLMMELPGILNWALVGLHRVRARGYKIEIPAESRSLVENYRVGEDSFARFVQDECEQKDGLWISNLDFYNAYKNWCDTFKEQPQRATVVAKRLVKMGSRSKAKRQDGKLQRGWSGIALKDENYSGEEEEEEE